MRYFYKKQDFEVNGYRTTLSAAVFAMSGMAAQAESLRDHFYNFRNFDTTVHHADETMYCKDNGHGVLSIYDGDFFAMHIQPQGRIQPQRLEPFIFNHKPNVFGDQEHGEEIWDIQGVRVSPHYQVAMAGHDVQIAFDTSSSAEHDGKVEREGAHCRLEITNHNTQTRTITYMPF
ncbi:MAG: hypothetical protein AAF244_00730 [Pseudomonadota bacterium]